MPSATLARLPAADWQADLRAARLTTAQLLAALGLVAEDLPYGLDTAPDFALKVPPHYLSLITPGDPHDPLLRQVLARAEERLEPAGSTDPLEEARFTPTRGLIRKYGSRALLMASGACAIHCRYCFRRHSDYGSAVLPPGDLGLMLAAITADPAIREIILSGGDPLTLSDDRLGSLIAALATLPQLEAIRLHTRTLTTVPARVTPALLALLAACAKPIVIVVHTNHAAEIDATVAAALARLRATGATLLNQSVLLRGVNDSAEVLEAHARRLFASGVLPYYLHLFDPVAGAAHFDVPLAEARALEDALRARLPGYLVPRLVREVPGETSKTPAARL
jgi:EF-P beta-lysylation protein EpmB